MVKKRTIIKRASKKKARKVVNKQLKRSGLSELLLRSNEYAHSLCNPFMTRGVKIPDMESFPTSTFSVVQRLQLTVTDAGTFAVRWENTPFFELNENNTIAGSGVIANQGLWYSNTDATPTDLFGGGGAYAVNASGNALNGSGLFEAMAFADDISNVISSARCVSAGLLAEYTGTALNNSGVFTAAFVPAEKIWSEYAANQGWASFSMQASQLQAEYHSQTAPVNSGSIAVTYHPLSPGLANSFADTYAQGSFDGTLLDRWVQPGAIPLAYLFSGDNGSAAFNNDWMLDVSELADISRVNYGHVLVICGTGMTPGATVQCTLVANFEGIPYTNQLSFADSAPSPVDTLKMDQALRAVPEPIVGHGATMVGLTPQAVPEESVVPPPRAVNIQQPTSYATESIPSGGHTQSHPGNSKNFLDTILDYIPKVASAVGPAIGALAAL